MRTPRLLRLTLRLSWRDPREGVVVWWSSVTPYFNGGSAPPWAGGCGWPGLGRGWPAPPNQLPGCTSLDLFFPLPSGFLFLTVRQPIVICSPPWPVPPGCGGRRLIFKNKGGGRGASVGGRCGGGTAFQLGEMRKFWRLTVVV